MIDWKTIEFFKREEFDSPDTPGSGDSMDLNLVKMLVELRIKLQMPLSLTSGFRTAAHNDRIGGTPNSAHLRGKAVDIQCITSQDRFKLLKAALAMGFLRIEIAPRHIHLDIDSTLPQEVAIHLAKY